MLQGAAETPAVTRPRSIMHLHEWPQLDQEAWHAAITEEPFGSTPTPASGWSKAYRRMVTNGVGSWLFWLRENHELDPTKRPGDRVTLELVEAFTRHLMSRMAPFTVVNVLHSMRRGLEVMQPGWRCQPLCDATMRLQRAASPSRSKLERLVHSRELFDLGLQLMETAGQGNTVFRAAGQFRDGLMIAILGARAPRLSNLHKMRVGVELVFAEGRYGLCFDADQMKARRPYLAPLPSTLTPYIDDYLRDFRPRLFAFAKPPFDPHTDAMWISRWGRPIDWPGIQRQIGVRTKTAFGFPIPVHWFRDALASSIAEADPEAIGIAAALLSHRDPHTTRKHYEHASMIRATREFQDILIKRKKELKKAK